LSQGFHDVSWWGTLAIEDRTASDDEGAPAGLALPSLRASLSMTEVDQAVGIHLAKVWTFFIGAEGVSLD
jgi:hypothetical protein